MTKQKKATTKPKVAVQEQPQAEKWLTTAQAARLLGVHKSTVARLTDAQQLRISNVKTRYGLEKRFLRAEIEQLAKQRNLCEKSDATVNATRSATVSIPTDAQQLAATVSTEFAEVPGLLRELITEQRRANDLRERELTLQEKRLAWEMSQAANKNGAAPRLEHAQEEHTTATDISISGEAATPMPPAVPQLERDVWQIMIELLEWLVGKLEEWR